MIYSLVRFGMAWGAAVLVLVLVAACGFATPLLSDVTVTPAVLEPTGNGETTAINYTIGRPADVSVTLVNPRDGSTYPLRVGQPRAPQSEPYTVRFDGTVAVNDPDTDSELVRQLLPAGDYTVVVAATASDGSTARAETNLTIAGVPPDLPAIENLMVMPDMLSPNADAIDDVTEITYRLPVTSTVDIEITTPNNQVVPLVTREEEDAAEQRHVWDGKRPDGAPLPSGVYTYTIRATDRFGNIARRTGQIELVDVGEPEATIVEARIAPQQVMLGEAITVTMRIRNTGDVPIRTYGPPSGYRYTTDEVYSSIEDGRYTAQAGGFWRVGMDWDANSGGGARRYPFRWALSDRPPEAWKVPYEEDWLMPGEEVEVVGSVEIVQRETRMSFYVGLIQDGVGFPQDRVARTLIEVGF